MKLLHQEWTGQKARRNSLSKDKASLITAIREFAAMNEDERVVPDGEPEKSLLVTAMLWQKWSILRAPFL